MECTGNVTVAVSGGTASYTLTIDDVNVPGFVPSGSVLTYPAGTHAVKVVDAHGCIATASFVIVAQPVIRDLEFHAYKDEKAVVKDAEAKLDTLWAAGTYVWKYKFNTCERTLNVKVIDDLVRTYPQDTTKRIGDGYFQYLGTVTAAIPGTGYFIQISNGPNSGFFVKDAVTVVKEGNGVKVDGYISEINSVLTITAAKVVLVNPPFTVVAHTTTSPQEAKQEKWESMLVKVKGARFMGTPNPDGSWVIKTTDTNTITVDDWMFSYTPANGHFFNVTGVINGAFDLYKLEPRKTEDVVDLFTTNIKDLDNLQFKVYPNPFSEYLNIDNSDKLTRVTVTNIAGQRVIDITYPERMIRTSNLVQGVYVVTLFTEEGIAKSERIVKR
jgi:hypothetical protein